MKENFNPDNVPSLTPVKLVELVDSDRIVYLIAYEGEDEYYRKQLTEAGNNLTFYVDKETNLALPLRMQLYTNRDLTLIPNQPIGALKYEQDRFMAPFMKFHAMGVELPFGYEFDNRRRFPGGDQGTYFEDSESEWKSDDQGKPLEARVDLKFNKEGRATSAISIVRYQL